MVLKVVDISHHRARYGSHTMQKAVMKSIVYILETELHMQRDWSDTRMQQIATLILAAVGAACIYAGYRLFCGLPAMNNPGRNRAAVFLMNMLPGALLALFGTVLLTTEARAMVSHRPGIEHRQPAAQDTSWHPGMRPAFTRTS